MENVNQSQSFLRKRKLMLVLPLLIFPFVTMAFWAAGGGKSIKANGQQREGLTGLNLHLPTPSFKAEKNQNKLSFYDLADKDSAKFLKDLRADPYLNRKEFFVMQKDSLAELRNVLQNTSKTFHNENIFPGGYEGLKTQPYTSKSQTAEEKVLKRLSELNEIINQSQQKTGKEKSEPEPTGNDIAEKNLDNLMKTLSDNNDSDPEIQQLNSMMDKVLDIQHPERVKARIAEDSEKNAGHFFTVSDTPSQDTTEGFFSAEKEAASNISNAIQAVVAESRTLVNGSVIKFRLLQDIFIGRDKIPAVNFVHGVAALNGERLELTINSIRCGNSIYPVKMEVYDMDGMAGIFVPGAITRDVAKQSADNSLQMMELTTFDPSLKAQAAAAGIGTIKNLLSRKVKQVKVSVKAGYKVLLVDKTGKQ